jgi:hypothetical protein
MRITLKMLAEFVNKRLDELKIDWQVTDYYRTRCSPNEYECGAAYLIFKLRHKHNPNPLISINLYSFLSVSDFKKYLSNGYELHLKLERSFEDSELTIKKKQ